MNAIEDQLPDLLITIAASLKAGHSFRQGLQAVVDEGQPPAADEFSACSRRRASGGRWTTRSRGCRSASAPRTSTS